MDECIALYGTLLNVQEGEENPCVMYIDITPGTPDIYRKELMAKLHFVGYDVQDRLLFGTDGRVQSYCPQKSSGICAKDNELYKQLGIDEAVCEAIYSGNLLRFLGIEKTGEESEVR